MNETPFLKNARIASRIISIMFHPSLVPAYGLLILFCAPTFLFYIPFNIKRIIFLLSLVNMTLVPLALLPFFRYRKIISSYSVENRIERLIPLGVGTVMYAVTTFVLFSYQIPQLVKSFMLGASVTSFLVLAITFRWKISIHSAGAGGIVATIMALSLRTGYGLSFLLIPVIILAGLVMTSRLFLGSHNPAQVFTGFITGFASFMVIMMMH